MVVVVLLLLLDYLLFIGLMVVGCKVMVVVVEYLVLVMLELGGKLFVIVCSDFLFEKVVVWLVIGKWFNVG